MSYAHYTSSISFANEYTESQDFNNSFKDTGQDIIYLLKLHRAFKLQHLLGNELEERPTSFSLLCSETG